MSAPVQPSPLQVGAEEKPLCRTCLWFKRRVGTIGECFEDGKRTRPFHVTAEYSCPEWTPKVVKA